jgi:hypothetical protein
MRGVKKEKECGKRADDGNTGKSDATVRLNYNRKVSRCLCSSSLWWELVIMCDDACYLRAV